MVVRTLTRTYTLEGVRSELYSGVGVDCRTNVGRLLGLYMLYRSLDRVKDWVPLTLLFTPRKFSDGKPHEIMCRYLLILLRGSYPSCLTGSPNGVQYVVQVPFIRGIDYWTRKNRTGSRIMLGVGGGGCLEERPDRTRKLGTGHSFGKQLSVVGEIVSSYPP